MRRWIAASMGAMVLAAVFASSSANLQAADKTVSGKVAAVSPDSITINARDEVVKLVAAVAGDRWRSVCDELYVNDRLWGRQ